MNICKKDRTIFAIPLLYSKSQQYPTKRKLSLECKICNFATGKSLSFDFAFYNIFKNLSKLASAYITKLQKPIGLCANINFVHIFILYVIKFWYFKVYDFHSQKVREHDLPVSHTVHPLNPPRCPNTCPLLERDT